MKNRHQFVDILNYLSCDALDLCAETHIHSVSTKHAIAGIPCFNQRCPSPKK